MFHAMESKSSNLLSSSRSEKLGEQRGDKHSADYSQEALSTVLNSLDALVYVSDMQTHEMIFMNDYGVSVWGAPNGRRCYEVLQDGQESACEFCTNKSLLDESGNPAGVHVWEFQNTQNKHWYQCRDQAIHWPDGRLVRIEIATDITERKKIELELSEAKALAERRSNTDALTGLNNRRAFFQFGRQAFHQASRANAPLSVIMFDLDHFKLINDTWGHAAGDAVLKSVTAAASSVIRASDVLGRLGGEEFAVLLPETQLEQACVLAERIREAIEAATTVYESSEIQCTSSLGVASLLFDHETITLSTDTDAEVALGELLKHADHAMMRAKTEGRNRVLVSQSGGH